jgi:uncharacterized protein YjlB
LPRTLDPAAVMEELFESNGWGDSWRNGIYDYLHYHSRINEVLGIARGSAKVRLGGDRGRTLKLRAGDVVILPAGTGHQCLALNGRRRIEIQVPSAIIIVEPNSSRPFQFMR